MAGRDVSSRRWRPSRCPRCFDDPALFGLRVALDGPVAKLLAGLAFEILYRRINDHLGVYHIELKLPDAVRRIEVGEATLTLPVIDVDVYTNGDFLVDSGSRATWTSPAPSRSTSSSSWAHPDPGVGRGRAVLRGAVR